MERLQNEEALNNVTKHSVPGTINSLTIYTNMIGAIVVNTICCIKPHYAVKDMNQDERKQRYST